MMAPSVSVWCKIRLRCFTYHSLMCMNVALWESMRSMVAPWRGAVVPVLCSCSGWRNCLKWDMLIQRPLERQCYTITCMLNDIGCFWGSKIRCLGSLRKLAGREWNLQLIMICDDVLSDIVQFLAYCEVNFLFCRRCFEKQGENFDWRTS
jgi:hypothetical protein